jgi:hypothetical protein
MSGSRRRWFMRVSRAAVVVACIALMSSAAAAQAAPVLYVDRGNAACSDSGSGTAAQPFCKIGAAASKVTAGQTIQVASVTYPESVVVSTSDTSSAPVTFTTAPGRR